MIGAGIILQGAVAFAIAFSGSVGPLFDQVKTIDSVIVAGQLFEAVGLPLTFLGIAQALRPSAPATKPERAGTAFRTILAGGLVASAGLFVGSGTTLAALLSVGVGIVEYYALLSAAIVLQGTGLLVAFLGMAIAFRVRPGPSTRASPPEMPAATATAPAVSPPASGRWSRRTLFLFVVAVAAMVIIAAGSLYVQPSPSLIPLTVSNGSVLGLIRGNLTSISSGSPLLSFFNATTVASQSGGPPSTLLIQLVSWTYYVAGPDGHYYDGGYIGTTINVTIRGHFASNLHPSDLVFRVTQIGQQKNGSLLDYVWTEPAYQFGANVAFDHNQELWVVGTGSVSGKETIHAGGAAPYLDFAYSDWIEPDGFVGHDRFVSTRATIEGLFTPSISVEIGLAIVDVPA